MDQLTDQLWVWTDDEEERCPSLRRTGSTASSDDGSVDLDSVPSDDDEPRSLQDSEDDKPRSPQRPRILPIFAADSDSDDEAIPDRPR